MDTQDNTKQRWRRAGPVALRSSLLVASWVASLRYGPVRRVKGAEDPEVRLGDFDRLARVLQDRVAAVRACFWRGVGDIDVLYSEIEHDIETGLRALNAIVDHEDRPFLRLQMTQLVDSLNGLQREFSADEVAA